MTSHGLYLHIPFCRKKCFYCSFVVAINQQHYEDEYARAVLTELSQSHERSFHSVYFGGGTPSRLGERTMRHVIEGIRASVSLDFGAEITVEMNPEDVSRARLQCYRDLGINRISLGVQSFQDEWLRLSGRCHDAQQATRAYEMIRAQGFDNVNVDLMYGFPGQTPAQIDRDFKELARWRCEHVSLYSLTVEPGSRFFVEGVALPASDDRAAQYLYVRQTLMDLGYRQYEVSNFCREGRMSQHNLNYWQGGNYTGLGVAAHSHEDGRRWWNVPRMRDYLAGIREGTAVCEGSETLSVAQRLSEALAFGLRMTDGVDLDALEQRLTRLSDEQASCIRQLVRDGFLLRDGCHLKASVKGLLVLDEIAARLM